MKKILFMHGGSGNHGCEAIVRTTSKLLRGPKDIILCSARKKEDIDFGVSACVELVLAPEEVKNNKAFYYGLKIKSVFKQKYDFNIEQIKNIYKGNIAISIGGDNYCYPWSEEYMCSKNEIIRKYCKKMVLWGCSIGPEDITNRICEDIKSYDLITARESISYELLKSFNSNTYLVADPAFLLEKVELPLPDEFIVGNTVGINISPLIMEYNKDTNIILKNYETLINFILNETDMNICLIPHVIWKHDNDKTAIDMLYKQYVYSGRVCKIDEGNAMELKGYISRCRFFIGARTHATIAAYSTCVPTIVVGYSIKSKGIAKDLFGTYQNYVVPGQNIQTNDTLLQAFQWLIKEEKTIKGHLVTIMPEYKEKARKAGEIFEREIIQRKRTSK